MGHVVVSLDAELAWGFHDRSPLTDATLRRVERGRRMWIQLLDLFDTYDVAATWAVVGHLLVRDREYTQPHPLPEEWFAPARKGLRERRELWLGDDLIETVASADADHELASHSFSHAEFPDVDREAAAAECRLARDAGDELGFEFDSFPSFLLWPLIPRTFSDSRGLAGNVTYYFEQFTVFLGTPRGQLYLVIELFLLSLALFVWALDGFPGTRWVRHRLQPRRSTPDSDGPR